MAKQASHSVNAPLRPSLSPTAPLGISQALNERDCHFGTTLKKFKTSNSSHLCFTRNQGLKTDRVTSPSSPRLFWTICFAGRDLWAVRRQSRGCTAPAYPDGRASAPRSMKGGSSPCRRGCNCGDRGTTWLLRAGGECGQPGLSCKVF